MLRVEGIESGYGEAQILRGVSLSVSAGEILCLMGRNGAGKTTTLKTIMGLLPLRNGSVFLDDENIGVCPAHQVAEKGLGYIPQGRRLFAELTVAENIEIGLQAGKGRRETRERVLSLFPRLQERLGQRAETLSGGEQQMLTTARALCIEPKVLLLDEPTEGLQPSMIEQIRNVTLRLRDDGVAIVLVEQRVEAVFSLADRVTFIENGQSRETVETEILRGDATLLRKYVGV